MYVCMYVIYGRVVEWLKRQRSNHATRVRIPLRSIYHECEFLINSVLGIELSAWHLWKVPEKPYQRVDPSHVREIG